MFLNCLFKRVRRRWIIVSARPWETSNGKGGLQKAMMLSLLLVCGTSQASEWVVAAHSKDDMQTAFVDVSSIEIVGGIRHFWDKLFRKPHTMKGFGENANKPIIYELSKLAFNCSEETVRQQARTIYYEDGTHKIIFPRALTKGWQPIPPDTVLSDEMHFICAWKPK
jgi:hypothetical protein